MVEIYYKTGEIAKMFGYNSETVRRKLISGQWDGVKIDGRWRVKKSFVDELLKGGYKKYEHKGNSGEIIVNKL